MWFRRDLRLKDNPALCAASQNADVAAVFVLDPAIMRHAGAPRIAWILNSLKQLNERLDGKLSILHGKPEVEIPKLARALDAHDIYISAEPEPLGQQRDQRVRQSLHKAGLTLHAIGSPYAIGPGTILKKDHTPFKVFSPFFKAWQHHGWPAPAPDCSAATFITLQDSSHTIDSLPPIPELSFTLPPIGETAALDRWANFRDNCVVDYKDDRNQADIDGTSRLSPHLKFGEIHPRTLLADLTDMTQPGVKTFVSEICWREFYADVLWHNPHTETDYLIPDFATMPYDSPDQHLTAWQQGRTGYPFVDAGMRQLIAEGWMHNRVRMVVASFLVKDLHLEWQLGAQWFMDNLLDGDPASNSHGWQWTAGCGTDASPYFRVFNPTLQAQKFDPNGDYVRKYIPELAHIQGSQVHEPWKVAGAYAQGYPRPIVDHAEERKETLRRFEALKAARQAGR